MWLKYGSSTVSSKDYNGTMIHALTVNPSLLLPPYSKTKRSVRKQRRLPRQWRKKRLQQRPMMMMMMMKTVMMKM